jgi:hypothetical protein
LSKKPRKHEGKPDDDPSETATPIDQTAVIDPKLLRYKLQMLAWIRVGLGIAAGVFSGFLGPSYSVVVNTGQVTFDPYSYVGLYVAFMVYIGSYYLGKYGLGIVLPQKDKNKLIMQGIGGYFMMFLFFWILYNTLCFSYGCPTLGLWP